jgi:hypothetical protein
MAVGKQPHVKRAEIAGFGDTEKTHQHLISSGFTPNSASGCGADNAVNSS